MDRSDRPVRTCIGCRGRAEKSQLLRLVLQSTPTASLAAQGVVVDPGQNLPGRGAYLHHSPECLDLAVRRRAVGRALKVSSGIDAGRLADTIGDFLHRA